MTGADTSIARMMIDGPVWIRSIQHLKPVLDRMIDAGHVERTKPKRGKGRNMVGLTAEGAEHYGLVVEPHNLIERHIKRIRPKRQNVTPEKRARHREIIAWRVSRGETVKSCAALIGMSRAYCNNLWAEIVRGLGWQAE